MIFDHPYNADYERLASGRISWRGERRSSIPAPGSHLVIYGLWVTALPGFASSKASVEVLLTMEHLNHAMTSRNAARLAYLGTHQA